MKIKILLLTVTIALVLFVLFYKEQTITDPKNGGSSKEALKEKNLRIETAPVKVKTPSSDLVIDFASKESRVKYNLDCGINRGRSFSKESEMSDIQLEAVQRIKDRCEYWYKYFDSMSETEKEQLIYDAEERKELYSYFMPLYEYDKQKRSDAKAFLVDQNDTELSATSLLYLLISDDLFAKEIAGKMNVKDHTYISSTSNAVELTSKYMCTLSKNGCPPAGELMTMLCTSDELACGLSHSEYLMKTHTINQVADLNHMLEIIQSLIKDESSMLYDFDDEG